MDETTQTTRLKAELRDLADTIQPEAQFVHDLEARLMMPKERKMLRLRRYGVGLVAGLGLMVMLTLTVPPLRTLAQEIIDSLFNQLDSDTTTHSYTRVEPDTTANVEIEFDFIEEAELSVRERINLVEPSFIPEEYTLTGVTLNANIRPEIREGIYFSNITYERRERDEWMVLNVMQSSADLDWGFAGDVGASATITPVKLTWGSDETEADYVEGNWINTEKNTDDNSITEVYEWDSTVPVRRLSWTDAHTLYIIQAVGLNPDDSGYVALDEMVEIAESMYADSLEISAGVFSTIADAEIATGMNILEPSFQPEGFALQEVIIPRGLNCAILMFEHPGRILRINQNATACGPRGNDVGTSAEITPVTLNWGGKRIEAEFVVGEWMSVDKEQTGDNEITEQSEWWSDAPFRRLRWQIDSIIYEIYAGGGSPDHPGYVGMQEMVEIAESMYDNSFD